MKVGLRPAEGGGRFQEALDQSRLAEELGFDSVWFGEHYCSGDYWWPSPLLVLSAIASHTTRIQLGTNILITPLYHPVHLASSLALVDQISGGRVIAGLGAGYDPEEFEAFGVPLRERLSRLRESIEILRSLWGQTGVNYDGKIFHLQDLTVSLQPVQKDDVPIWIGGWGDKILNMTREYGCTWVAGPTASLEMLQDRYQHYSPPQMPRRPMALVREVVVSTNEQNAWDRAVQVLYGKYLTYIDRGHPYVNYRNVEEFKQFAADRFLIGTPDQCLQQLLRYHTALPIGHLICKPFTAGMSAGETEEAIRLLAQEVLPTLQATAPQ